MDTTAPAPTPLPDDAALIAPRGRRGCRSIGGFYIAATVIAFLVFWPLGLAMLVWAIWRKEIKASSLFQKLSGPGEARHTESRHSQFQNLMSRRQPSNTALAAYLQREQDRLKTEQDKLNDLVKAFDAFKDAERQTADQQDFEAFLRKHESDQRPADATPQN